MRQSYRNSGPRLPATSENTPSTHSGEHVGWFVVRDALVEVDYVLRLHEHALCDDNSLWKERRVEPNSNARADKVAIVTAAGSGMGAACAWELAGRGYAVALMSASGKAEALAKELGGLGLSGSVTEEVDLEALVGRTLDRYGRVDGWSTARDTPRPVRSWSSPMGSGTKLSIWWCLTSCASPAW
jgi:hypothetical protein